MKKIEIYQISLLNITQSVFQLSNWSSNLPPQRLQRIKTVIDEGLTINVNRKSLGMYNNRSPIQSTQEIPQKFEDEKKRVSNYFEVLVIFNDSFVHDN